MSSDQVSPDLLRNFPKECQGIPNLRQNIHWMFWKDTPTQSKPKADGENITQEDAAEADLGWDRYTIFTLL